MSDAVEYLVNKASEAEIVEHLSCCDADFMPTLSSRVEIKDYARKIRSRAMRFEAWAGGSLVGLVAAYCNDKEMHIAHITSVSVLREWKGKGVAAHLMSLCVKHAMAVGMRQIGLEVAEDNMPAIKLYEKSGFVAGKANESFVAMHLNFKSGEEHEQ